MSYLLTNNNAAAPSTPAAGKLAIYSKTDKQLHFKDENGTEWAVAVQPAVYQATPSNPTGTTNTGGLMMGLAGAITPIVTGRVLIQISGTIKNSGSGDGANVQIRTGTGGAPANAAALTGNTAGGLVKFVTAAANQSAPFSIQAIVTGLTLSTAIWIDVGLAAVTAGTASITDVSISAFEL